MVAHLAESTEYQYGFHDDNTPLFKAKRGLSRVVVDEISSMKVAAEVQAAARWLDDGGAAEETRDGVPFRYDCRPG